MKEDSLEFALLQPWFLPKRTARAIMRLLPREYKTRMRWMFEDYGCFLCGKKGVPYGGNGFCRTCRPRFRDQMIKSMMRRLGTPPALEPDKEEVRVIDRTALARELLSEFVRKPLLVSGPREDIHASELPGRKPRIGPNGPRPKKNPVN
jgi:hypothetical protein